MDKHRATATFFLDKRRINNDSKFPLKLTIYHRPDKKRFSTGIALSVEEWNKLNALNLKDEGLKKVKLQNRFYRKQPKIKKRHWGDAFPVSNLN